MSQPLINYSGTNLTLYYSVLEYFKTIMSNHPSIGSVTQGDIFGIDDKEFPIYPLGNILVTNATFGTTTSNFSCQLTIADKVKLKNNESSGSYNEMSVPFEGVDDVVDIHSNTLAILNDLTAYTQRNIYGIEIDGDIDAIPFRDNFDSGLAGWVCNFDITVHNDKNRCLLELIPTTTTTAGPTTTTTAGPTTTTTTTTAGPTTTTTTSTTTTLAPTTTTTSTTTTFAPCKTAIVTYKGASVTIQYYDCNYNVKTDTQSGPGYQETYCLYPATTISVISGSGSNIDINYTNNNCTSPPEPTTTSTTTTTTSTTTTTTVGPQIWRVLDCNNVGVTKDVEFVSGTLGLQYSKIINITSSFISGCFSLQQPWPTAEFSGSIVGGIFDECIECQTYFPTGCDSYVVTKTGPGSSSYAYVPCGSSTFITASVTGSSVTTVCVRANQIVKLDNPIQLQFTKSGSCVAPTTTTTTTAAPTTTTTTLAPCQAPTLFSASFNSTQAFISASYPNAPSCDGLVLEADTIITFPNPITANVGCSANLLIGGLSSSTIYYIRAKQNCVPGYASLTSSYSNIVSGSTSVATTTTTSTTTTTTTLAPTTTTTTLARFNYSASVAYNASSSNVACGDRDICI